MKKSHVTGIRFVIGADVTALIRRAGELRRVWVSSNNAHTNNNQAQGKGKKITNGTWQ